MTARLQKEKKLNQTPSRTIDHLCSLVFIFFGLIMLSSCIEQPQSPISPSHSSTSDSGLADSSPLTISSISSLPVSKEQFIGVAGWLDSNTIAYSKKNGQTYELVTYNFLSKRSESLFESTDIINQVSISPSRKSIAVHVATSSTSATINLIDNTGKKLYKVNVPSFDVIMEWNPFIEGELILTAFDEAWTYQTYKINYQKKTKIVFSVPQPFFHWRDRNRIIYLDWNQESPALTAPLSSHDIDASNKIKTLLPAIAGFIQNGELLIAAEPDENQEQMKFHVFNKSDKEIATQSFPLITSYSEYIVPYMTALNSNKEIALFIPDASSNIDTFNGLYQLKVWNIETNQSKTILENVANEPILRGPNQDLCLYGYQYEKIIDMQTGEVFELVE